MKNSSFNKIISWLLVSGMLSSCKKLIQIPASPPNQIAQVDVFSDSTGVMSAAAGVYSYSATGFAFYDGSLTSCTGLSSDELSSTSAYSADVPQLYNNAVLSDNGLVASFWRNIYSGLYKVNVCLEGIGSSSGISPALKQQLLGEMEVVRALYYFNLVNLFGGVPLVTSTDYHTTAFLPRATVDEVYTQIMADLSDAKTKLQPAYPSAGHVRANQYTAMALLARMYLYRGQWQDALDMANQVISSGVYQLEPDLNKVFLDGSHEAIWQLPATSDTYQTQEAFNFVPASYPGSIPGYILTTHLTGAFEPGDQRLQNWVGTITTNVNGVDQLFNYPYKYKNATASGAPTIEDYMVFRLSELYLIRAEANAQLNNLPDARTDLDQVRSRAGLPNSTASTQPDILTAIMHERQTELFCEWGNRWYDLKRTGTIDAVLGAEKPGWQPYAALYPIPYLEARNNTNLVQNPGYH